MKITNINKNQKPKISLQAYCKDTFPNIESAVNGKGNKFISDEISLLSPPDFIAMLSALRKAVKSIALVNTGFFVLVNEHIFSTDRVISLYRKYPQDTLLTIVKKEIKDIYSPLSIRAYSEIYDELIEQNAKEDGVIYDLMLEKMHSDYLEAYALENQDEN